MDLKQFQIDKTELKDLVVAVVPKGKFIMFKTGEKSQEEAIEKGDVLLGVMPKADGTEAIGFYEYDGEGNVVQSERYNSLTDHQTQA